MPKEEETETISSSFIKQTIQKVLLQHQTINAK